MNVSKELTIKDKTMNNAIALVMAVPVASIVIIMAINFVSEFRPASNL